MSNTNEHSDSWARLIAFLDSDEGLSTQAMESELKAEGVDVDGYTSRMQKRIRQLIQERWREEAEQERCSIAAVQQSSIEVAAWSPHRVREWLDNAVNGALGPRARELAAACYRNKTDDELSEGELRSWVADIKAILDQEKPAP